MPPLPLDRGPMRMRVRVAEKHPRVVEATRILARIFLRIARQERLDSSGALSPDVAVRGADSAPEKCT
jgi:hypothetical protein